MCALEVFLITYLQMSHHTPVCYPISHQKSAHNWFHLTAQLSFLPYTALVPAAGQALRVFLVLDTIPALKNTQPVEDADTGAPQQLSTISCGPEARPWHSGDASSDRDREWEKWGLGVTVPRHTTAFISNTVSQRFNGVGLFQFNRGEN